MSYALHTLWFERQRFFAAVLAVAFSTILICVQFGLLLGTFALTSVPIDKASADIWLGGPDIVSVDIASPIPTDYLTHLASQPEVDYAEPCVLGFNYWNKSDGGSEFIILVGTDLSDKSLGAVPQLTPELRSQLTEPGAIVVDRSELAKLGNPKLGESCQIGFQRTRLVGIVEGLGGLQGPYIFCSLQTARQLLRLPNDQTIFVLAKCKDPQDVSKVVGRLNPNPEMSVLTASAFSLRSRMHWLMKTNSGVAMAFAAVLGLLVGAVVTRQSLYSATVASIREYAVLRALGIPRWRMAFNLAMLAFWVGLMGVALALPLLFLLYHLAMLFSIPLSLPWWLLLSAVLVTWLIAIVAGLTTLNALQQVEPIILLR